MLGSSVSTLAQHNGFEQKPAQLTVLDILSRLRMDATEDAEATTESIRANLDGLS